jgi:aspartate/methionine/tyrosine aminotransferase
MAEPTPVTARAAGLLAMNAASERSGIAPFMVMDVMQAAARLEAEGRRIVHMEVGQPGTAAPRSAREAVRAALETESLGYTLALGLPALRARIARHYLDWYGVTVPAERVVVTNGSSAAFVLSFLALFDVGDRVALPAPGYPCYRHILTALGQRPVRLVTGPDTRWMPTAEQLEAAHAEAPLKGLLVASPANPTGTMLEPERQAELVALCRRLGLWYVADEIYHGLTWEGPAHTALEQGDDVVVINSFSKYFSMTGWRVGWMVVPEALVRPIERLAQNLYISPPAVAQVAALGAFDGIQELEANKAVYAENRRLLLEALPRLGLDRIVPADGAFYLYVDVSALTDDSIAFTRAMLEETGVAATPGLDFDDTPDGESIRGARFVRFSYAGNTADMAEALARLARWPRLRVR